MKTQSELAAMIASARKKNSSGELEQHAASSEDTTRTNSWGPQMRV